MNQQFTRTEVARMIGVSRRQLDYWAQLGLVEPQIRWGERFYNFADLVALETVKQLTARSIPARRLRRAILALQTQLGEAHVPLSELRVSTNGRQVVVHHSAPRSRPFEPLSGQFVLDFEIRAMTEKVRAMAEHTAEQWFEIGLANDSSPDTLERAADAYRRALELAPDWIEAHINLGTTLYGLQQMEEAQQHYTTAAQIEPGNPLAHFNLGCVLEQLGDTDRAIEHLRRAVHIAPSLADAHLNLALAYEKRGQKHEARKHLSQYLLYEPRGPWADFARSRVGHRHTQVRSGKLTPFRRRV